MGYGMDRERLVSLNEHQPAHLQRLHDFMCSEVGIFEMLEASLGQDDVELLFAGDLCEPVNIGSEINIHARFDVCPEVLTGVGEESAMPCRYLRERPPGAEFKDAWLVHQVVLGNEVLERV